MTKRQRREHWTRTLSPEAEERLLQAEREHWELTQRLADEAAVAQGKRPEGWDAELERARR